MTHIADSIAKDLTVFKGHMECNVCLHEEEVGDIAHQLKHGWKTHCGQTMTWITAKQEAERLATI